MTEYAPVPISYPHLCQMAGPMLDALSDTVDVFKKYLMYPCQVVHDAAEKEMYENAYEIDSCATALLDAIDDLRGTIDGEKREKTVADF